MNAKKKCLCFFLFALFKWAYLKENTHLVVVVALHQALVTNSTSLGHLLYMAMVIELLLACWQNKNQRLHANVVMPRGTGGDSPVSLAEESRGRLRG